jgi:hypothetical protein
MPKQQLVSHNMFVALFDAIINLMPKPEVSKLCDYSNSATMMSLIVGPMLGEGRGKDLILFPQRRKLLSQNGFDSFDRDPRKPFPPHLSMTS